MRNLREKPSPGVNSVSFNRRPSRYCTICIKQSLPFCLGNPTMVSLDGARSVKRVTTLVIVAVQFILIGPPTYEDESSEDEAYAHEVFGGGRDQGGRGQRDRRLGNHEQEGRMFGNFESRDYRMKMDLPSFNGNL
ncbi:hypothetical protein Acr_00g0100760 [Actinidia rufa]|uniref:Uncharacterized protein n=1 Tax=Actinidia rufa TaxID=165716 RepID=A0A7J0DZZ8_9ERIC|nr:hypothetical protein Acr_00g0100760 [Actinidia rufa]